MMFIYFTKKTIASFNTDNILACIGHKLPVVFNRKISTLLVSEKVSYYIGKLLISWFQQVHFENQANLLNLILVTQLRSSETFF